MNVTLFTYTEIVITTWRFSYFWEKSFFFWMCEKGFTSERRKQVIYGREKHRNRRNKGRIIGK